jgi:hypothetical protein
MNDGNKLSNRDERLRMIVLSAIADDYESFRIIAHETSERAGKAGLGVKHEDILDLLAGLIHEGLAKGYVLSSQVPYAEPAEYSPELAHTLWYLITDEGKQILKQRNEQFRGHPLALDPDAPSASLTEPAFVAKPEGAPVYHGFQVLSDVVVDGFSLGKITDFEAEDSLTGDAFVVAPDNSRAGLVWEVSRNNQFEEVMGIALDRWGVWAVSFPYPMTSRENLRRNLESILPELKREWEQWRRL